MGNFDDPPHDIPTFSEFNIPLIHLLCRLIVAPTHPHPTTGTPTLASFSPRPLRTRSSSR